jgi:GTP-binding protein
MAKLRVVAILGRPNVGKSTLFNRLTGVKEAIVDDLSGVTRDRKYGRVEWNGKFFEIIDTGGYVPNSKDIFEKAIREQVNIAIDEANAILFVVDAKNGLSPFDEEIAKMLKKYTKKLFLIINKVDSQKDEVLVNDFYKLGIDSIYGISGLQGRNIGDLLDDIVANLDFGSEIEEEDTRLKISIVGRPNAGKSTLTNTLLGENRNIVTDIPGTTRDSIDSILKYYGEEIVLIDTAGLRKRSRIKENIEFYSTVRTLKAIDRSDISILMIDAKLGIENQDLKILEDVIERRNGVVIAVNKWDLIVKDSKTANEFKKILFEKLGKYDYIPIVFISAVTKQRVFKLLDICKEIYYEKNKKITTSELNDYILPEIQNYPPPATKSGKEVKIKYVTQADGENPVFLFFTNEPKAIPDSYKRYLEKLLRKQYGFQGVPITIVFKQK